MSSRASGGKAYVRSGRHQQVEKLVKYWAEVGWPAHQRPQECDPLGGCLAVPLWSNPLDNWPLEHRVFTWPVIFFLCGCCFFYFLHPHTTRCLFFPPRAIFLAAVIVIFLFFSTLPLTHKSCYISNNSALSRRLVELGRVSLLHDTRNTQQFSTPFLLS